MNHEFRNIDPRQTRILLIEGGPRVLAAYSEDLSRKAEAQLQHLGVEVRTSHMVTRIEPGAVWVGNEKIPAPVILWAAGVAASPLGRKLGVPVDRAGRVLVQPDLSIPGHPEVFVIGDLAALNDENGKLLPESRTSPFSKATGSRRPSRAISKINRAAIFIITTKAAWPPSAAPPPSPRSASSSCPDISPGWHGCSSTFFSSSDSAIACWS